MCDPSVKDLETLIYFEKDALLIYVINRSFIIIIKIFRIKIRIYINIFIMYKD